MEREGQGGLEPIKTFCRFAPTPQSARRDHADSPFNQVLAHTIQHTGSSDVVHVSDMATGSFVEVECEKAFDGSATQQAVHDTVTLPLIPKLLQGYNVTLLAFGQTASGKTHTMLGPEGGKSEFLHMEPHRGLVPRTVETLFRHIEANELSVAIELSFFEIYNEVVSDLIAKATACDRGDKSFAFRGTDKARFDREVSRVRVSSIEEFLHILEATNATRQQGGTDLNQVSSRSHSVVQLRVYNQHFSSTMCMVDLAGSECIKKSNAVGMRRYETKNINTSLFALKQVIHALYKRKEHVPYADSMLTRVLADSLSGNAFLSILVCCTTRAEDAQETMATLRFAREASCVLRKSPTINRSTMDGRRLVTNSDYEAVIAERDAAQKKYEEAMAKIDELNHHNATLAQQVSSLKEGNSRLAVQLNTTTEQFQAQVTNLHNANKSMQCQLFAAQAEQQSTASQNQFLSGKVTEVQRHMDGILAQIQAVTSENDGLRAELRQSRINIESLQKQIASLQMGRIHHSDFSLVRLEGSEGRYSKQDLKDRRGASGTVEEDRRALAHPVTINKTLQVPQKVPEMRVGGETHWGCPPPSSTPSTSSSTLPAPSPLPSAVPTPTEVKDERRDVSHTDETPTPTTLASSSSASFVKSPPVHPTSPTEKSHTDTSNGCSLAARLQRLEQVLLHSDRKDRPVGHTGESLRRM